MTRSTPIFGRQRLLAKLAGLLALAFWPSLSMAFDLTLATFTTRFSQSGPGLLLQRLQKGDRPQVEQDIAAIVAMQADVLVLTNFDYDYDGLALGALQKRLADHGLVYADAIGLQTNSGIPTGLDLNHDGALGGPREVLRTARGNTGSRSSVTTLATSSSCSDQQGAARAKQTPK